MNKWNLSEDVRNEYKPIIERFLNKMETLSYDEFEELDSEEATIDFSDTRLSPYTLLELLREFGYEDAEFDRNGWELDFWIYISREDMEFPSTCENLCIHGCGMTFELNLSLQSCL